MAGLIGAIASGGWPTSQPSGGLVTVTSNAVYNAFPGLTQLQNNTLVVVYRAATDHESFDGVIKQKKSTDNGATWSVEATAIAPGTNNDARDPEIITLANGNVLMSYFVRDGGGGVSGVFSVVGTVSGDTITWGTPSQAHATAGTSSKPIVLGSGDIILPIYTGDPGTALVVKSTDSGATWGGPVVMIAASGALGYTEANGILLSNDRILIVVRHDTNKGYVSIYSNDHGATWSAPDQVYVCSTPGKPSVVRLSDANIFMIARASGIPSQTLFGNSVDQLASLNRQAGYRPLDGGTNVYGSAVLKANGKIGVIMAEQASSTDSKIYYQDFG